MRRQLSRDFAMDYDDIGQGVAVVLLHAFPLSRAMWRPQTSELAGACRIVTPDLRGFGGSDPFVGTPALQTMADDIADLLDALALPRVVLGGLSMGGYVALAFARKYAERLCGLVLADTRADADTPEARANRDRLIAFARSHSAGEVLDALLPKLVSEATRQSRPAVLDEVRRIAAAQSPAPIVAALEAMRDRPDAAAVLDTLEVPALVVVGAADPLTPPAVAETMAARLPHSRLEIIADAGHLTNLEQPEAFNQALRRFVAGLP